MGDIRDLAVALVRSYTLTSPEEEGQYFLVDEAILSKEIEAEELNNSDVLLDIGAGFGFTLDRTRKLCKCIAIEKDIKLYSYLINKYETDHNVELINDDATRIIFPKFNKVIANLPYSITDRVLIKLSKYEFDFGVGILPNTICQNLLDPETNKSKLGIILNNFFSFDYIMDVPPSGFYPSPRVTSKLIKFSKKKKNYIQAIMSKDEMTLKNAILRTHREMLASTKNGSRGLLSKDLEKIKDIDNMTLRQLDYRKTKYFIEFIKNDIGKHFNA